MKVVLVDPDCWGVEDDDEGWVVVERKGSSEFLSFF
jgi:hypothetical protein